MNLGDAIQPVTRPLAIFLLGSHPFLMGSHIPYSLAASEYQVAERPESAVGL